MTLLFWSGFKVYQRYHHKRQSNSLSVMSRVVEHLREHQRVTGSYPSSSGFVPAEFGGATDSHGRALVDGWGNPLHLIASAEGFVLWSNGRDNRPDNNRLFGPQDDFDADLIRTDEGWWQWPLGLAVASDAYGSDPFARVGTVQSN